MEVLIKFSMEMPSKISFTSEILQPSKEILFDSFMNKSSEN